MDHRLIQCRTDTRTLRLVRLCMRGEPRLDESWYRRVLSGSRLNRRATPWLLWDVPCMKTVVRTVYPYAFN